MSEYKKILWVKSVKRNSGSDWAYEELNCKNNNAELPQKLHWRNDGGKTAAKHAKVGEIILLFQTLNHGPYRGVVRLTHLISPISESVLVDKRNPDYKWYREVQVIAKANPIHAIVKPEILDFRRVGNGGLTFKIDYLANDKIDKSNVQKLVWKSFSSHLCSGTPTVSSLFPDIGPAGEKEGDMVIRRHIDLEVRNRNLKIVKDKKFDAFQKGNGHILCECCDFDFLDIYGNIGEGFIECHHKVFLSQGERITNPEDLALVCSNCHRILHRKNRDNTYYSVEDLRSLILG